MRTKLLTVRAVLGWGIGSSRNFSTWEISNEVRQNQRGGNSPVLAGR